MVGLLDIAEVSPETVDIRGTHVAVNGLSAQAIARVLARFESLQKLLEGQQTFGPTVIIEAGPEVVAEIIAAGTGAPDDERVKAKAATLTVGEQYDLISKIVEVTFGKNLGPFVEKLRELWVNAGVLPDPGKASSMTSQPRSRASLRSATTPEMFGHTHPGNSPATPS